MTRTCRTFTPTSSRQRNSLQDYIYKRWLSALRLSVTFFITGTGLRWGNDCSRRAILRWGDENQNRMQAVDTAGTGATPAAFYLGLCRLRGILSPPAPHDYAAGEPRSDSIICKATDLFYSQHHVTAETLMEVPWMVYIRFEAKCLKILHSEDCGRSCIPFRKRVNLPDTGYEPAYPFDCLVRRHWWIISVLLLRKIIIKRLTNHMIFWVYDGISIKDPLSLRDVILTNHPGVLIYTAEQSLMNFDEEIRSKAESTLGKNLLAESNEGSPQGS